MLKGPYNSLPDKRNAVQFDDNAGSKGVVLRRDGGSAHDLLLHSGSALRSRLRSGGSPIVAARMAARDDYSSSSGSGAAGGGGVSQHMRKAQYYYTPSSLQLNYAEDHRGLFANEDEGQKSYIQSSTRATQLDTSKLCPPPAVRNTAQCSHCGDQVADPELHGQFTTLQHHRRNTHIGGTQLPRPRAAAAPPLPGASSTVLPGLSGAAATARPFDFEDELIPEGLAVRLRNIRRRGRNYTKAAAAAVSMDDDLQLSLSPRPPRRPCYPQHPGPHQLQQGANDYHLLPTSSMSKLDEPLRSINNTAHPLGYHPINSSLHHTSSATARHTSNAHDDTFVPKPSNTPADRKPRVKSGAHFPVPDDPAQLLRAMHRMPRSNRGMTASCSMEEVRGLHGHHVDHFDRPHHKHNNPHHPTHTHHCADSREDTGSRHAAKLRNSLFGTSEVTPIPSFDNPAELLRYTPAHQRGMLGMPFGSMSCEYLGSGTDGNAGGTVGGGAVGGGIMSSLGMQQRSAKPHDALDSAEGGGRSRMDLPSDLLGMKPTVMDHNSDDGDNCDVHGVSGNNSAERHDHIVGNELLKNVAAGTDRYRANECSPAIIIPTIPPVTEKHKRSTNRFMNSINAHHHMCPRNEPPLVKESDNGEPCQYCYSGVPTAQHILNSVGMMGGTYSRQYASNYFGPSSGRTSRASSAGSKGDSSKLSFIYADSTSWSDSEPCDTDSAPALHIRNCNTPSLLSSLLSADTHNAMSQMPTGRINSVSQMPTHRHEVGNGSGRQVDHRPPPANIPSIHQSRM